MSEDPEQQNVEGGEGAEPVAPKNILKAE
jgi:Leucine-rich repeat (LRR) protein